MKKIILLAVFVAISCNTSQKKQKDELPGRLGNKDLTVNNDKRINQDLLKAIYLLV